MRSELGEPGRGMMRHTLRRDPTPRGALPAVAVDAALADEAEPIITERGSRREVVSGGADAGRRALDGPHEGSTDPQADRGLLRQLSHQLSMLEIQQAQIRRLLEQTERRTASADAARVASRVPCHGSAWALARCLSWSKQCRSGYPFRTPGQASSGTLASLTVRSQESRRTPRRTSA